MGNILNVVVDIRFRRTGEGGLRFSFSPYNHFTGEQCQLGYPMDVDGEHFDFRIVQPPQFIELGRLYRMKLRFLSPDIVSQRLTVGKKFTVWYSRTIADGVVVKTADMTTESSYGQRREMEPDFYLVARRNNLGVVLTSCFLRYSSCPHDQGCVCGMYAHDVDCAGVASHSKDDARQLALYSPIDVLAREATWPLRVTRLGVSANEGGIRRLVSLLGDGVLFKDLPQATDYAKGICRNLDVSGASISETSILEDAKRIICEGDLYGLVSETKETEWE